MSPAYILEFGGKAVGILLAEAAGFVLVAVDPLHPLNNQAFATVADARTAVRRVVLGESAPSPHGIAGFAAKVA